MMQELDFEHFALRYVNARTIHHPIVIAIYVTSGTKLSDFDVSYLWDHSIEPREVTKNSRGMHLISSDLPVHLIHCTNHIGAKEVVTGKPKATESRL